MSMTPVPHCSHCQEYESPTNPTVAVGKSDDDEAPKFTRTLICLRCTVLAYQQQAQVIRGGIPAAKMTILNAETTIDVLTRAAAVLGIDLNASEPSKPRKYGDWTSGGEGVPPFVGP